MTVLRLGSFNALSGRSLRDGVARPDLMARALAELDLDVLALQEVDRRQPRSGGADQPGQVAVALGAVDHRFVATVLGTPGLRGWQPGLPPGVHGDPGLRGRTRPEYGIALVSRLPVQRWEVLGLTGARGRYPLLVPDPRGRPSVMWLRDEPRAAVAAVLADPPLTVACAHLSFVPGYNVRQLRRVVSWLRTLPGPRILLGDLNLPGRLPGWFTGWRPLLDEPTYPSPSPRLQLDHLLADGLPAGARIGRAHAVALPVSDHRAVVAELRLP